MNRKTPEPEASDWMAPFMASGKRIRVNVAEMTPQQRAEAMARGVPTGVTNMETFVEQGLQVSKDQAERASRPRADENLKDIVRKLAKSEGSTKELWPQLFGRLEADGYDPKEHCDGKQRQWKISYTVIKADGGTKDRKVSFDKFQTMLGEYRKPK